MEFQAVWQTLHGTRELLAEVAEGPEHGGGVRAQGRTGSLTVREQAASVMPVPVLMYLFAEPLASRAHTARLRRGRLMFRLHTDASGCHQPIRLSALCQKPG